MADTLGNGMGLETVDVATVTKRIALGRAAVPPPAGQHASYTHDRRDNRRSSRPDRIPPVRAPIPRGLRISISTFAAGFVARRPLRVPAVPVARISSRGRGGEVRRGRAAARGPYVLGMLPPIPAPYAETARPDFLPGTLSTW